MKDCGQCLLFEATQRHLAYFSHNLLRLIDFASASTCDCDICVKSVLRLSHAYLFLAHNVNTAIFDGVLPCKCVECGKIDEKMEKMGGCGLQIEATFAAGECKQCAEMTVCAPFINYVMHKVATWLKQLFVKSCLCEVCDTDLLAESTAPVILAHNLHLLLRRLNVQFCDCNSCIELAGLDNVLWVANSTKAFATGETSMPMDVCVKDEVKREERVSDASGKTETLSPASPGRRSRQSCSTGRALSSGRTSAVSDDLSYDGNNRKDVKADDAPHAVNADGSITCLKCCAKRNGRRAFISHFRNVHAKRFRCDRCGWRVDRRDRYNAHRLTCCVEAPPPGAVSKLVSPEGKTATAVLPAQAECVFGCSRCSYEVKGVGVYHENTKARLLNHILNAHTPAVEIK